VRFVNQPTDMPRETHATARHATPKIDSRSKVEKNPHVETAKRSVSGTRGEPPQFSPGRQATPKIESRFTIERDPHVETPTKLDPLAVMRAEAKQALESLGFKPARSKQLVEWAVASEPTPMTLEQLIRVALRYSR
jgi:hypothetical protein